MDPTQNRKGYKKYINGLRGLACLLIMMGHYLRIYRFSYGFEPRLTVLDQIFQSQYAFLLDDHTYRDLFYIISGYLAAMSAVRSFYDLAEKCVLRFLRLALPAFFACAVIYLIYCVVGFHNSEIDPLFLSDWYQSFYAGSYSLRDVLKSPIEIMVFMRPILNLPYWVLRYMYFASCVIYLLTWLCARRSGELHTLVTLVAVLLFYPTYPVVSFCLCGSLIYLLFEREAYRDRKRFVSCFILILSMFLRVLDDNTLTILFFSAAVLLIPRLPHLNAIFSASAFQYIGKISWGIYSFHMSVVCSFGAIFLLKFSEHFSLPAAFLLAILLSVMVTVLISALFYPTLERLSYWLVEKTALLSTQIFRKGSSASSQT